MAYARPVPVAFLIVFSFYLFLGIRIPGLFNYGGAGAEIIDAAVGFLPLAIFLCFVASVIRRALLRRITPWPLLITLVASIGTALAMQRWVEQLPGQAFKAVGAYFYLASPLIAALGIVAIWTELRSARHSN
jgi:branched-subunit amino acid ABC-type transport system permease component